MTSCAIRLVPYVDLRIGRIPTGVGERHRRVRAQVVIRAGLRPVVEMLMPDAPADRLPQHVVGNLPRPGADARAVAELVDDGRHARRELGLHLLGEVGLIRASARCRARPGTIRAGRRASTLRPRRPGIAMLWLLCADTGQREKRQQAGRVDGSGFQRLSRTIRDPSWMFFHAKLEIVRPFSSVVGTSMRTCI